MNAIYKDLKDNNQDFEFYPTTKEMLRYVYEDIKLKFRDKVSILDIGAGNGSALNLLESFHPQKNGYSEANFHFKKYAIEKSKILLNQIPEDVFIIGTDFYEQSLIDKNMDIIFCNPPYSEYETWLVKILEEAHCKRIYLVVPHRWKNKDKFSEIMEKRNLDFDVLGNTSFHDSEFRKARANVDIVTIKAKEECNRFGRWRSKSISDPFRLWFEKFFKVADKYNNPIDEETHKSRQEKIQSSLIEGKNLIECLVDLYGNETKKLLGNYQALENVDPVLLKELGVSLESIMEGLRLKIEGLKNLYWKELFKNLNKLTDRLTEKTRKLLVDQLFAHTSVDFTASNAYALVSWAIKNANVYFEKQLLDVYYWMTKKENIQNYKSNKVFLRDGWRYGRHDKLSHYYLLDYRLVFQTGNNFQEDRSWVHYNYLNGLNRDTHEHIQDILVVARNLGFTVDQRTTEFEWEPGKEVVFTSNGKDFLALRVYKNGNIHCKPNKEFIKKLNIEAGRLNGWLKTPEEAAKETGVSIKEAVHCFNSHIQIDHTNTALLIA